MIWIKLRVQFRGLLCRVAECVGLEIMCVSPLRFDSEGHYLKMKSSSTHETWTNSKKIAVYVTSPFLWPLPSDPSSVRGGGGVVRYGPQSSCLSLPNLPLLPLTHTQSKTTTPTTTTTPHITPFQILQINGCL